MSDSKKKSSSRTSKRDESIIDNDSSWADTFRASLGELWSCFLIGLLAAGSNVWTRQFTGHSLDPLSYGATFGLLYIVTGIASHGLAWFISPSILGAHWWTTPSSEYSWQLFWQYVVIGVFQLGGWFLAATAFWGITGGDIDNAAALSNVDNFWVIFFIELVGQTLLCQVYLSATSALDSSIKYIAVGLAQTVLVGVFFNVTGGSFNFWRSLAFQVVLNRYDTNALVACGVAGCIAPFLAVAWYGWIFTERARRSNSGGYGKNNNNNSSTGSESFTSN